MSICPDCNREAPNMEHCERCNPAEYPTHCSVHGDLLGEGDMCGSCEAAGDALIAEINECIKKHGATLYAAVFDRDLSFRVPVQSFNEAKDLFSILHMPNIQTCRLHYIGTDGLIAVHTFI